MQDEWTTIAEIVKRGAVILISDHRENTRLIAADKAFGRANEWAAVLALSGLSDGIYEIQAKIEDGAGGNQTVKEVWIRFIGSDNTCPYLESI